MNDQKKQWTLKRLAELEAMIAVKRHIIDDGDEGVPEIARAAVERLERMAVTLASPLDQPPDFAIDLIRKHGEEENAVYDFTPAEAPTNGPYLDAIWKREAERQKRRK